MRSRLHRKQLRYLDVACRYDRLQGGCDTWIPSAWGYRECSTSEKQRFRKSQESATKQTSVTTFLDGKQIQEIAQNITTRGADRSSLSKMRRGQAENGKHQKQRGTREHTSSSADSEIQSELKEWIGRYEWNMKKTASGGSSNSSS